MLLFSAADSSRCRDILPTTSASPSRAPILIPAIAPPEILCPPPAATVEVGVEVEWWLEGIELDAVLGMVALLIDVTRELGWRTKARLGAGVNAPPLEISRNDLTGMRESSMRSQS